MRISDWSSDVCSSDLLVPMNRGILSTIYVRAKDGPDALHAVLAKRYADEPFVKVMKPGQTPATRQVRGSNYCFIGVAKDRRPGRAIVVSALDNLVKGAAGQAVQNMNLMAGLPETTGLQLEPMFPWFRYRRRWKARRSEEGRGG